MKKARKIKIAWLAPTLNFSKPGGIDYMEPLFCEFQKIFPNTTFITAGDVNCYYKTLMRIISVGKCRVKTLYSYNSGYGARTITAVSPMIFLSLLRLNPDVILTPELGFWTIIACLLKPFRRWKVIVFWTGSSVTVDFLDDPLRLSVRKLISGFIDTFITNSKTGKKYLKKAFHFPDKKIFQFVYKPPDAKALKSRSSNTVKMCTEALFPCFICVGQLIKRKGLEQLFRAWQHFQQVLDGEGCLWIIGDGPEKRNLKDLKTELGLDYVQFIGKVDFHAIGYWYEAADVFVFPTLEDIWGHVALEAMVFGKPILCSRYAGACELVQNGENGFVFDPNNPQELAELMIEFVRNKSLISYQGKKSLESIRPHNPEIAAEKIGAVINKVLNVRS